VETIRATNHLLKFLRLRVPLPKSLLRGLSDRHDEIAFEQKYRR
jgi:hypothetical protein